MKKAIVFLFCIMVALLISNNKAEKIVIPKDSIRFRILANSNSIKDQRLKLQINSEIFPILQNIMKSSNSISETRINIERQIPIIKQKINTYTNDFNIIYGNNYFPQKEYKDIIYEEGQYESLVVTLGNGNGDNWWCVMFPPLCLLEVKEADIDKAEYTTYIKKIINKYF